MRYLDHIETARRYSRSVNIERDSAAPDTLKGYVLTPRVYDTLALFKERAESNSGVRAFTITAVYGAGKSAFMHFLLSLLAPKKSAMRETALGLLKDQAAKGDLYRFFDKLANTQPPYLCAQAVSRGESITETLTRALGSTINQRSKSTAIDLVGAIEKIAATRPVLIAIDELGKNLEHAAAGDNDLYLLQMLAEIKRTKYPVFFFGLLHSAFADYGGRLAAQEKSEWAKIQGRFEDISFLDAGESTMALIGAAISSSRTAEKAAEHVSRLWQKAIPAAAELWQKVFPLHPLAARALPLVCARLGQNERSLFNFLTGHEPHSFYEFLSHTPLEKDAPELLKIHHLYDYFIDAAAPLASGERFSRLVEMRDRVAQNTHLDQTKLNLLKTVAVLNLLPGTLKAAHETLILSELNSPTADSSEIESQLRELVETKTITYRKQADEYRLWAGSETDIETLIKLEVAKVPGNLAESLNTEFRLRSVVASRHSFATGTLRYFPSLFVDNGRILATGLPKGDGYVFYDISPSDGIALPMGSGLAVPVIRVTSKKTAALRMLAREVIALQALKSGQTALTLDAVAKREVSERYFLMAERLREMVQSEFTVIGRSTQIECFPKLPATFTTLNQIASALCDAVYSKKFILHNELINRQNISSQVAKARGEIMTRLLKYRGEASAHFAGNGPEVSIYRVLTDAKYDKGLKPARAAIEKFAAAATTPQSLSNLFKALAEPPFGIRAGVIPLLLVQYLIEHEESVSLYQEGSFIPEITTELLEVLVRRPERFALKKFVVSGLEAQYFEELSRAYGAHGRTGFAPDKKSVHAQSGGKVSQPRSLLTVVRPLVKFNRTLPRYTQQTLQLSEKTQRLRTALTNAREPDTLIFEDIPRVFDINLKDKNIEGAKVKTLTKALSQTLHELQNAYLKLLEESRAALLDALRIGKVVELREYLAAMAGLLSGQILDPLLRRFMNAAADKTKNEQQWLEGILMVVADKPAESWRDDDRHTFAANLATLAQKFLNLHQLAAKVQAAGNGKFDARLVTITQGDGREAREVVWADAGEQKQVRALKEYLNKNDSYKNAPPRIQQAALVEMIEALLLQNEPKVIKIEHTPKDKKYG